jgi:hypothetical protein
VTVQLPNIYHNEMYRNMYRSTPQHGIQRNDLRLQLCDDARRRKRCAAAPGQHTSACTMRVFAPLARLQGITSGKRAKEGLKVP